MDPNLSIDIIAADRLSDDQRQAVLTLLPHAYKTSRMHLNFARDLAAQPERQLCALATHGNALLGFAMTKPYANGAIPAEIVTTLGEERINLKHVCVHPEHRGRKIGRRLIERQLQAAFDTQAPAAIWAESKEIGALKLYARMGALFYPPSIEACNDRLTPAENTACFRAFLASDRLNSWQLAQAIGFAFPRDAQAAAQLARHGFKDYENIPE